MNENRRHKYWRETRWREKERMEDEKSWKIGRRTVEDGIRRCLFVTRSFHFIELLDRSVRNLPTYIESRIDKGARI